MARRWVSRQVLLRVDYVKVSNQAAGIAIIGNLQCPLRRVHGLLLGFRGFSQHAQPGKRVFHFLKGCEHGLPVVGDRSAIA